MPTLRDVSFWPDRGWVDNPWDDPKSDAFVRTARRVVERYSEGLRLEKVPNHLGGVMLSASVRDGDNVDVSVPVDRDREGSELSGAALPPGTEDLSPERRALLVLEVVDAAMRRLAQPRGWPADALDRTRDYVLQHGLQFDWAGPWKWAPDRRTAVRPRWRIEDDGFGRLWFELRLRGDELPTKQFQEEWSGDNCWYSFKRRSKELRWTSSTTFEMSAHWDEEANRPHVVRRDLAEALPLRNRVVDPIPLGTGSGYIIRAHGWGRTAPEQGPEIVDLGVGLDLGAPADYGRAVSVLGSHIRGELQLWWAAAERTLLYLDVSVMRGARTGASVRERPGEVSAELRRPVESLAGRDPVSVARADVRELLDRVARKYGLPSPPLPTESEVRRDVAAKPRRRG